MPRKLKADEKLSLRGGIYPFTNNLAASLALLRVGAACCDGAITTRFSKARLVAEHGEHIGLPDLRARLAVGCRLVTAHIGNETCGAVYPQLAPPDAEAKSN